MGYYIFRTKIIIENNMYIKYHNIILIIISLRACWWCRTKRTCILPALIHFMNGERSATPWIIPGPFWGAHVTRMYTSGTYRRACRSSPTRREGTRRRNSTVPWKRTWARWRTTETYCCYYLNLYNIRYDIWINFWICFQGGSLAMATINCSANECIYNIYVCIYYKLYCSDKYIL